MSSILCNRGKRNEKDIGYTCEKLLYPHAVDVNDFSRKSIMDLIGCPNIYIESIGTCIDA